MMLWGGGGSTKCDRQRHTDNISRVSPTKNRPNRKEHRFAPGILPFSTDHTHSDARPSCAASQHLCDVMFPHTCVTSHQPAELCFPIRPKTQKTHILFYLKHVAVEDGSHEDRFLCCRFGVGREWWKWCHHPEEFEVWARAGSSHSKVPCRTAAITILFRQLNNTFLFPLDLLQVFYICAAIAAAAPAACQGHTGTGQGYPGTGQGQPGTGWVHHRTSQGQPQAGNSCCSATAQEGWWWTGYFKMCFKCLFAKSIWITIDCVVSEVLNTFFSFFLLFCENSCFRFSDFLCNSKHHSHCGFRGQWSYTFWWGPCQLGRWVKFASIHSIQANSGYSVVVMDTGNLVPVCWFRILCCIRALKEGFATVVQQKFIKKAVGTSLAPLFLKVQPSHWSVHSYPWRGWAVLLLHLPACGTGEMGRIWDNEE